MLFGGVETFEDFSRQNAEGRGWPKATPKLSWGFLAELKWG